MEFRDAVKSGFEEHLWRLRTAVDGLAPDEIRWQPDPQSNHIAWIVWHMARVQDAWTDFLSGNGQLWEKNGWPERLGIPAEEKVGGGTPEEAAALPTIEMDKLLAYYDEVQAQTLSYLDRMTDEDLERHHDQIGPTGQNGAWVIGHLLVEQSQHLGQVAYIRGQMRGVEKYELAE